VTPPGGLDRPATRAVVHVVLGPLRLALPDARSSRTWIAMSDRIASPAVRAPDFPDTLEWLHTGGRRLTLGDFRGKLLLLDFWTYG
jgi:hypothetical protein